MKAQKRLYSLYKTLGLFICAMAFAPGAQAETTNCTAITSLPYTITTQGVYCFTGHLGTAISSGNAITINANNVTLDLNGFKLGGLAAGAGTTARGIYAYQRKNITIRNGIVRGFRFGIFLSDASPYTTSQGHLIEDILADQNTSRGITVSGRGMTLRRNQVVDTGGSTVDSIATGIRVRGAGNKFLNNDITTTVATSGGNGAAYGMILLGADGAVIQNNRVTDTQADGTGSGYGIYLTASSNFLIQNNSLATTQGALGYGIYATGSSYVTVDENTVVTADYGIFYTTSTGIYKDNLTDNISTTKYTSGTDAGGNF